CAPPVEQPNDQVPMPVLGERVHVQRRAHLRVGPRVIEEEFIATYMEIESDADHTQIELIAFHVIDVRVDAIGNGTDDAPGLGLGIVENRVDALLNNGYAVLFDQGVDAVFGGVERGDARLHVAPVLAWNAAVRQEYLQKRLVYDTANEQLARWYANAFVIDFVARRRDATGHLSAHVGRVDERPGPTYKL